MPETRFVKQTKLGRDGNCLEACIASLAGIPLVDFPDLSKFEDDDPDYWKVLNEWLQENYNIYAQSVVFNEYHDTFKRGLVIASGSSPNCNGLLHAVVWDFYNDELAFDPSPSGKGIKGKPESFILIVNFYEQGS